MAASHVVIKPYHLITILLNNLWLTFAITCLSCKVCQRQKLYLLVISISVLHKYRFAI